MASETGRPGPPLKDLLKDETYRFEFFQAVRLLERLLPLRYPVGRGDKPSREVVRFRTRAALSFPPSQLYELKTVQRKEDGDQATIPLEEVPDGDQPPQLTVAFMGLTGPVGVLPTHYTEQVIAQAAGRKYALWDFLDLFSHRMISLFYRAWEKSHFPIAWERIQWRKRRRISARPGEPVATSSYTDQFSESLFAVIGLGTGQLKDRLGIPDADKWLLCYSGLIAQQPHSARTIETILRDYFAVQIRLQQCCGQWLKLSDESLAELVQRKQLRLGVNTVIGRRVWDTQGKFRLQIGPLTFKQFMSFLPTGSAWRPAVQLTRFLARPEFDFDLQLILTAAEVKGCVVTTRARRRPRLGWTTWLTTREPQSDYSRVILSASRWQTRNEPSVLRRLGGKHDFESRVTSRRA